VKKIVVFAISLMFLHSPAYFDLNVKWVKVEKEVVVEGEIVEIKARIEGNGISEPFAVYFFIDSIDDEHLIGRKTYDSIKNYRMPRIEFDTRGYEGKHEIIVCVYDENEENNIARCNITILKFHPSYGLLIKEVYYYAHPNKNNEFICIQNCGNETYLDYFYLTTSPWKRIDKQNKVYLPHIKLRKGEKIYITQNATAFLLENGFEADYEYYDSSPCPDLNRKGSFRLANGGGCVAIKDMYNHTIDCVVFGNFSYNEGWNGRSVEGGEGYVLVRKGCIDTNSSVDWVKRKIGWSSFPPYNFTGKHAIFFCSPDCSYKIMRKIIHGNNISANIYMFTHPWLYEVLNKSNATIRILLDGNVIGGIPEDERYIAWKLSRKGEIRYMWGNEKNGIYKRYRYDHAKYAIVDNKIIITSCNWVRSGIPVNPTYGNREWGVSITDKNASMFLWNVFKHDFNPKMEDSILFNESDFFMGKPKNHSINFFISHGNYRNKFHPLFLNESFNATIILSPDNGEEEICRMIDKAKYEILVEQAYIQKDWHEDINPFLKKLIEKKEEGVKIKVLMNYNRKYRQTNKMNEETLEFLKENNIEARLSRIPIHNKGMIVDDMVLISSINWGENSVRNNREIGIIIENENVSNYFRNIFYYDWNYSPGKEMDYEYILLILLFTITFLVIYSGRKKND